MSELFKYPSKDLEYWNGCQRNWDYSRPVESSHVKRFVDIAVSAPSKNNLNLLEIQVFENSLETQKSITEKAKGQEGQSIKTSTEAPLTFFFGIRKKQHEWLKEESPLEFYEMERRANGINEDFNKECMKQTYMAASLIVGAISIKAIEFGYKTGINCCFLKETKLYNSENVVFLSVGIGHPFYDDHLLRNYSNNMAGRESCRTKHKTKITHIKNNIDITKINSLNVSNK
jgi:hypothetical protein